MCLGDFHYLSLDIRAVLLWRYLEEQYSELGYWPLKSSLLALALMLAYYFLKVFLASASPGLATRSSWSVVRGIRLVTLYAFRLGPPDDFLKVIGVPLLCDALMFLDESIGCCYIQSAVWEWGASI